MSKFNYYNSKTKVWSAPKHVSIFNPENSLGDILLYGLSGTPDKLSEFHDESGVILKCKDILHKSIQVAEKLKSMNLKPGDVVSFACRNVPGLTSLICGCILAGLVVNPVNPDYQTDMFKHIIDKTKPKLIFCHKNNKIFVKEALEELCHISNIINVDNEMSVQPLFESFSNDYVYEYYTPALIKDTEKVSALILATAGSTGLPKCVTLTHSNVVSQLLRTISVKHDDIVLVPNAIYLFSGIATTLIGIATGAMRIVTGRPFDAEIHLKLIEKFKVTKLLISPAHLSAMVDTDSFKTYDLSSIKLIQTGGEALLKTLKETVENQLFSGKVVQSYGLVEVCGTATLNYPISKEYSLGRPVLQNLFKIIDESGNNLGPREEGEICIKAPYPFAGYCFDEVLAKEVVDQEGYFHTGDIGYFDDEDFLFIVGRCQETIQYTGHQI